jgi:hypothetical protein
MVLKIKIEQINLFVNKCDMMTSIIPKLPMRNKAVTSDFYLNQLGFVDIGSTDYKGYLFIKKDTIEIHFF